MQSFQQSPHRPVMWNRVRHRHNRLEPEYAVGVATHDAPSVGPIVVSMLHVVVAGRVGFPDVDFAAFYGLAGRVLEGAEHETWLASCVGGDGGAVWKILGFVSVKRAKDGAFGTVGWFGVVNGVD